MCRDVGLACSLEHLITLDAGRKSGCLLANLFRPFGQATFEGYRLLLTPPLQYGAAPLLGAGGSAIYLPATGAYENVTLPTVKRKRPATSMVAIAEEETRVISVG